MAEKTVNVLLVGYTGRMGSLLFELIKAKPNWNFVSGIDIDTDIDSVIADIRAGNIPSPNLVFDFSNPDATVKIFYDFALEFGIPMVTGTTDLPKGLINYMKTQKQIPILQAYNMSYNMKLFKGYVYDFARNINPNDYQVCIYDEHHEGKKDAPSGTAIDIAEAINAVFGSAYEICCPPSHPRKPNEISISYERVATVAGLHIVRFIPKNPKLETIEFKHIAGSRDVFAEGAMRAAEFILDKPAGYYTMAAL